VFFLAGVNSAQLPRGLLQQMNVDMPRLVAARVRTESYRRVLFGMRYPFVRPETGGATEQTPASGGRLRRFVHCRERNSPRRRADGARGHIDPLITPLNFVTVLLVDIR